MLSAASPGRSIPEPKSVWVFDLDETILTINSFPHWVRYMLVGRFGGLTPWARGWLFLQTLHILAHRKLLRCNHYKTKRKLQMLWRKNLNKDKNQIALHKFVFLLSQKIRPQLQAALGEVAHGNVDAVLATAAVDEYARSLGESLGFRHILTTPSADDANAVENSKLQKRDRVLALLAEQGWSDRKRIFFTDHEEDLPLITESHMVIWFGDVASLHAVKAHAPHVTIMDATGLNAEALSALVKQGQA